MVDLNGVHVAFNAGCVWLPGPSNAVVELEIISTHTRESTQLVNKATYSEAGELDSTVQVYTTPGDVSIPTLVVHNDDGTPAESRLALTLRVNGMAVISRTVDLRVCCTRGAQHTSLNVQGERVTMQISMQLNVSSAPAFERVNAPVPCQCTHPFFCSHSCTSAHIVCSPV